MKRRKVRVVLFPPISKTDWDVSNWQDKTKDFKLVSVYRFSKLTEKARGMFEGWSVSDFLFYGEGRIPTDLFG